MNKVMVVGRIGNDLEIRKTRENKSTLFVLLMVDKGKDKEGNQLTDRVSFTLWEKTAENFCKYNSKGDLVSVEGHLMTRKNEDKYELVMVADKVQYLAKSKANTGKAQTSEAPPQNEPRYDQPSYAIGHEDLPWF